MNRPQDGALDREQIQALLRELDDELGRRRITAQIYVVGGSAMALAFDARRVTQDIDAVVSRSTDEFWEAADAIAARHGLPRSWINDNARPYLSSAPDDGASGITLDHLTIVVASTEHLIAMKLRRMRPRDIDDLDHLFRIADVRTPEEAAEICERLFDDSSIACSSPEEVRFDAKQVFLRAQRRGNPIPGPDQDAS